MSRQRLVRTAPAPFLALLTFAIGCGGGGTNPSPPPPPPPPGPVSVASVALDQADLGLVPQYTVQLTATAKDANGNTLTGRAVTWQSSAGAVASVSGAGLVTGLTVGTTTITATSEGRVASASVTVREGAVVGPAGGTVIAAGGNAKLTIPAGALTNALPISVTPLPVPPSPNGVAPNTAYELGPTGTTFSAPVQLEFKYTQKPGIDSAQAFYRISRYTDGKWIPLPGSSGGQPGGKVTAQTSSFSTYGISWVPPGPALIVTPVRPVVFLGQTTQLTATLNPIYAAYTTGLVTRLWSGSSSASVSQTGLVTGLLPAAAALIFVTDRFAHPCSTPCYVGIWDYGLPTQVDMFADTVYSSLDGGTEVVVALIPIKAIAVTPTTMVLAPGQQGPLSATLKDGDGAAVSPEYRTIVWTTTNASVATVSQAGLITAVAAGTATISATVEGISGSMTVTVTGSASPVVEVETLPWLPKIEVGNTWPLMAIARDNMGQEVTGLPVVWASLNHSVATVTQSGVVTAVSLGQTAVTATIGGVLGGSTVTVVPPYPLVTGRPGAGGRHSCLLRAGGSIWCWGNGAEGQLGNGATTTAQLVPMPVSGGHTFTALAAGEWHTCALDAGGLAWCWGKNLGVLGDGTTIQRLTPTAVAGGKVFAKIFAGSHTSCGLEANSTPWCWGGLVGDGAPGDKLTPQSLVGGLAFTTMALGFQVNCGLTPAGAVWCWGFSGPGMGEGSSNGSFHPVAVATGHVFTTIVAGRGGQVCGLKVNGEAWCWGHGSSGMLGNGGTSNAGTPVKVATTVAFTAITAGGGHSCALAVDQTAWCWGSRTRLGSVWEQFLPFDVTTPVQVFGGRSFTEISSGGGHTCARAADGTWCWGDDVFGELGSGVLGGADAPTKVRFP